MGVDATEWDTVIVLPAQLAMPEREHLVQASGGRNAIGHGVPALVVRDLRQLAVGSQKLRLS
jgi:hypothetical protein